MVLKVFAVYDSKASAYLPPFMMHTQGQAIRAFSDTVNAKDSILSKHPEDYTLFEVATFEETTAVYVNHEAKLSLGLALEFVIKEAV